MTTSPPTPPGWYPDPQAPGYQRYWDGAQWTEHVAPLAGPTFQGPPPEPTGTSSSTVVLIVVGVIVGFLVLIVLLIAAVTLLGGNASSKFSTIGSSIN